MNGIKSDSQQSNDAWFTRTGSAGAFQGYFADKTVLVTGHTGFVGAWAAIWLIRLGARVFGCALDPESPSLFSLTDLQEVVDHHTADIRDAAAVAAIVAEAEPDVVLHFAAQASVRHSLHKPLETFATNVLGTINLLEAVRAADRTCIVVAMTSDKCYDNQEWSYGYRETDRLGGNSPYSASKAAAEIAISAYRQSYFPVESGVLLASVRGGNALGGGDWAPERLMPNTIRAFMAGTSVNIRDPLATRPWQHVLDLLSGCLWLVVKLAALDGSRLAGPWNFGPPAHQAHSVEDLVRATSLVWGGGDWRISDRPDLVESRLLGLSIDKAVLELGWRPVWDFASTIQRTVEWYRRFHQFDLAASECRAACLADIAAYESDGVSARQPWAR